MRDSKGHASRYSAVIRGLRPRSPAGLRPAPTRELAQLPVATKGNGIPAHIHVRRVASLFWRVSRLTLIPFWGYPRKAGHSQDRGIASVRATPRYRSAVVRGFHPLAGLFWRLALLDGRPGTPSAALWAASRSARLPIPWHGFALHPPGSALLDPHICTTLRVVLLCRNDGRDLYDAPRLFFETVSRLEWIPAYWRHGILAQDDPNFQVCP